MIPAADPGDTIAGFIDFMAAHGVHPLDPIGPKLAGGGLVRFRADGDGPGRANGWAVLHNDAHPTGVFGHYRLGIEGVTWRGGAPRLTPDARRILAAAWREQQATKAREEAERHAGAAKRAEALWEASRLESARHLYVSRKRIGMDGLRVHAGDLIAPMRDPQSRLWNVQRIAADGTKRFLPGGRVRGLCWRAGHMPGEGEPIALGEGVATMAAVRVATRLPVAAAMSAGNLQPVALALRTSRPSAIIILCADLDASGVGQSAASEAARAVGGLVARPPRPADWPDGQSWDFADTWAAPDGEALIRVALTLGHGGAA